MPATWRSTHCYPNGPPTPGQLVVPNVPGFGTLVDPGGTNRRGVVVSMHGLSQKIYAAGTPDGCSPPTADIAYFDYSYSYDTWLNSNGWIRLYAAYPEDASPVVPGQALINDAVTVPGGGNGARILDTYLKWWDHIVSWIHNKWGQVPIVVSGGSHGGWMSMAVAAYRASSLTGAVMYCPATIWQIVSSGWVPSADFNHTDMSGMELPVGCLNGSQIPMWGSYSNNDQAVGYCATTVDPGHGAVDLGSAAFLNGTGTLYVTDPTSALMVVGPAVKVTTSTGTAIVRFTTNTAGVLGGCTTTFGGGTVSGGERVAQSNAKEIFDNAGFTTNTNAQKQLYVATDGHFFGGGKEAAAVAYIQGILHPIIGSARF